MFIVGVALDDIIFSLVSSHDGNKGGGGGAAPDGDGDDGDDDDDDDAWWCLCDWCRHM